MTYFFKKNINKYFLKNGKSAAYSLSRNKKNIRGLSVDFLLG
jgi:hypothetical protein